MVGGYGATKFPEFIVFSYWLVGKRETSKSNHWIYLFIAGVGDTIVFKKLSHV